MKMKKSDFCEIALTILVIVDILVVILVTASILAPPKRSKKANKVDLGCVTELKRNPLKECEE